MLFYRQLYAMCGKSLSELLVKVIAGPRMELVRYYAICRH